MIQAGRLCKNNRKLIYKNLNEKVLFSTGYPGFRNSPKDNHILFAIEFYIPLDYTFIIAEIHKMYWWRIGLVIAEISSKCVKIDLKTLILHYTCAKFILNFMNITILSYIHMFTPGVDIANSKKYSLVIGAIDNIRYNPYRSYLEKSI